MSQVRALVAEQAKIKVPCGIFIFALYSSDQARTGVGSGEEKSSPVEEGLPACRQAGLGKPRVSQMFCPGRGAILELYFKPLNFLTRIGFRTFGILPS